MASSTFMAAGRQMALRGLIGKLLWPHAEAKLFRAVIDQLRHNFKAPIVPFFFQMLVLSFLFIFFNFFCFLFFFQVL